MVFWDVTPCSFIDRYQRFGGTHCLHLLDTLNMEAALSSEALVPADQITRHHNPTGRNLHIHSRETIKPYKILLRIKYRKFTM
jgi:hypothetical protein